MTARPTFRMIPADGYNALVDAARNAAAFLDAEARDGDDDCRPLADALDAALELVPDDDR